MPHPSRRWVAALSLTLCIAMFALVVFKQATQATVLESKDSAAEKQNEKEDQILATLEKEALSASAAAKSAHLRATAAHNLVSPEMQTKMKTAAEQSSALKRENSEVHESAGKAKIAVEDEAAAAARYVTSLSSEIPH
jgi:hypothetical protein